MSWIKIFCESFSFFRVSEIWQNFETWTEKLKFILPVMKSCHRNDNQKRSPNIFLFCQMSQQSNGLNGLTKTHFISKDTIDTLIIQVVQPLKTLQLICFQISLKHIRFLNLLFELHLVNVLLFKIIIIDFLSVMLIKLIKSLVVLVDHLLDVDPCGTSVDVYLLVELVVLLHVHL